MKMVKKNCPASTMAAFTRNFKTYDTLTALSLAWSRQHDFVASTIVGATSVEQLEESLASAELILDAATLKRIDEIDEAIPCPMKEDGLRRL